MKKIKIALIGAGKMMDEYLKVLSLYRDKLIIEGIYSRTKKKSIALKKKYKIKYLAKNIDDLYLQTKADIVFIVVSVENVKEVCISASKFKWKCYVEKPFGISYSETKELNKKLNKKVKNFYIAFNRDYYQSVLTAEKFLKKDVSRRIITIYDQQSYNNFSKYLKNKKFIQNIKYSNSIHLFTIAKRFARKKYIKTSNIYEYKNKKTKYFVEKMVFSSGDVIFFHSIWNRPGPWKVDISTDKYFLSLEPLERLFIRDFKNRKKEIRLSKYDKKYKPGVYLMIKEFLKLYKKEKANNINYSNSLMKIINETKI